MLLPFTIRILNRRFNQSFCLQELSTEFCVQIERNWDIILLVYVFYGRCLLIMANSTCILMMTAVVIPTIPTAIPPPVVVIVVVAPILIRTVQQWFLFTFAGNMVSMNRTRALPVSRTTRCGGCTPKAQLTANDIGIIQIPGVVTHGAPFASLVNFNTAIVVGSSR